MWEPFEVITGAPMRDYTTLRLGGPADVLAFPGSAEEVSGLFARAAGLGWPVTVMGRGSNLLVLDGGIRGLVLRIGKKMSGISVRGTELRAQAGAMLGAVAAAAAEAGLSGLEFAGGIPGTVGGGVVMNAGAYGGEMAQVIAEVRGVLPDGEEVLLGPSELAFGYRRSAIPARGITVTEAVFRLTEGHVRDIRARMAALQAARAEKQPLDVPSAGSTFKRPEGHFAAALIDQCGLKGFSVGGAMVSPKHAGFLVNTGSSAADFLALMEQVQRVVEEKTGVRLEPEIRILGEEAPGDP